MITGPVVRTPQVCRNDWKRSVVRLNTRCCSTLPGDELSSTISARLLGRCSRTKRLDVRLCTDSLRKKHFSSRGGSSIRLVDDQCNVAIYIAPTRALVTEVEEGVRAARKEFGASTVEVTSLPLADKYLSAVAGGSKVVFVLTQERLHLLANALYDEIKIDLLVVDEAHKIGDNQRGVVLQDAIERLTRINPFLQAAFVSPATQNPARATD